MMINPLNPFDNIRKVSSKEKVDRPVSGEIRGKGDSVEISPEAKKRLEIDQARSSALSAPEVRSEKVNLIKEIINSGDFEKRYLNDEVLGAVAGRIVDDFLGNN